MLDEGERAAQLAGAAERLREPFALRSLPVERRITEARLEEARQRLAPEQWTAAWTTGRALRLDEVLVLALADV